MIFDTKKAHLTVLILGVLIVAYPPITLVARDPTILSEELIPLTVSSIILLTPYVLFYKFTKSSQPTLPSLLFGLGILILSVAGEISARSDAQGGLIYLYILPLQFAFAYFAAQSVQSNSDSKPTKDS